MHNANKPAKEFYSETEAAETLGISLCRLHALLDQHVFNDGAGRPSNVELRSSELVLLAFWHRSTPHLKVLRMPQRRH